MKTKNARASNQNEGPPNWLVDGDRTDGYFEFWVAYPEPGVRIDVRVDLEYEQTPASWDIISILDDKLLDSGTGKTEQIAKASAYQAWKNGRPWMNNKVDHPSHYQGKVECIDAIEAATDNLSGVEAFCTGNAIKYLYRWKNKGGVEDLKKAKWYIDRIINSYPPEATSK